MVSIALKIVVTWHQGNLLKEIQVIVSIADFELQPGQSYEGDFHVDCMPHEHIVAVADVTLSKDDHFKGGELFFKRGFPLREVHSFYEQSAFDGMLPLGKVPPKEGRVTVFPNTHIHRLLSATNTSTSSSAKRRGLIFFVLNPNEGLFQLKKFLHLSMMSSLKVMHWTIGTKNWWMNARNKIGMLCKPIFVL
jgi:hypothetical protein